jgi:hypothetical protein
MKYFYWVMAVLIVGTFVPSALYLVMGLFGGDDRHFQRAKALWNFTRVLTLFGANILVWGHVVVGLWQIWFG